MNKRTSGQKTDRDSAPGRGPNARAAKPRAHRNDTPEAKMQQERSPKTHPTRAIGGRRKGQ